MAYTAFRKCPECGSKLVERKFRHPDPLFALAYEDLIGKAAMRPRMKSHYCGADFSGNWVKREAASGHLECICLNCGCRWQETPSLVFDTWDLISSVST